MRIQRIVSKREDVDEAVEACIGELKERLWRECWKGEIELPGVRVEKRVMDDGHIELTVEI